MSILKYQKPIFTSLSPNTEKDDIDLVCKLIFDSKDWKEEKEIERLEWEFKQYLGVKYAFSFNSGRSALLAILEGLRIRKRDEILLQGFTCNAAVNPILKRGAKPVFVDVDDTINIDPEDLKKKITPNSRAVIVQHNFGWPAKINKISKIAKRHNLFLIEDCAHSLGAKFDGNFCGTFGDAAFFSFGRDKIISSVFGGMAVANDNELAEKIKNFQEKLDYPSNLWIFQQLLHPILTNFLVMPIYGFGATLGKIILGVLHKLSILSKAVYKQEKRGKIPEYFPKRLPNALAVLALNQFRKLERFNQHRREIANFYSEELKNTGFILPLAKSQKDMTITFMRYPILAKSNTDKILKEARKRKIYLNDGWRKSPVVPPDTNIKKTKYKFGSCPIAENISETIVNLPTHINISKNDALRITNFLKELV